MLIYSKANNKTWLPKQRRNKKKRYNTEKAQQSASYANVALHYHRFTSFWQKEPSLPWAVLTTHVAPPGHTSIDQDNLSSIPLCVMQ